MSVDDVGDDPFSRLLYPMLGSRPERDSAVIEELSAAPLEKAAESERLRERVLDAQGDELLVCARRIAASVRRGGRILVCGNGGSATSAADMAAELLAPPASAPPIAALCLTNDVAVVTAVANDVSFDDVFSRQVIALGREQDVVVAISTSGNSENLVRGLREASRHGMLTVALCGYDGGRIAAEAAVDHCFVVPSSSVHRVQEVQTSVHHLLVELLRALLQEEPACA